MKWLGIYRKDRDGKGRFYSLLIMKHKTDGKYSFVNLTKGHICPCKFDSIADAMKELHTDERIKYVIELNRMNDTLIHLIRQYDVVGTYKQKELVYTLCCHLLGITNRCKVCANRDTDMCEKCSDMENLVLPQDLRDVISAVLYGLWSMDFTRWNEGSEDETKTENKIDLERLID